MVQKAGDVKNKYEKLKEEIDKVDINEIMNISNNINKFIDKK